DLRRGPSGTGRDHGRRPVLQHARRTSARHPGVDPDRRTERLVTTGSPALGSGDQGRGMPGGYALWSIVATSTHSPPFSPLRLDLRQSAFFTSIVPPPFCE